MVNTAADTVMLWDLADLAEVEDEDSYQGNLYDAEDDE